MKIRISKQELWRELEEQRKSMKPFWELSDFIELNGEIVEEIETNKWHTPDQNICRCSGCRPSKPQKKLKAVPSTPLGGIDIYKTLEVIINWINDHGNI